MRIIKKYDNRDPISIEKYAKGLIGKTFQWVKENSLSSRVGQISKNSSNKKGKGVLGNLIEEHYFGIKPNSDQEPDFKEAGVELKVTPFLDKKGKLTAKERLVLTMISYQTPVTEDFYQSHVWAKCRSILLIYYCHDEDIQRLYLEIKFVKLFTPPEQDQIIIVNDYKYIVDKIKNGLANELSEADTMYLGACTKGSTAEKSTVNKCCAPGTTARTRAFAFKTTYMTIVLNKYIIEKDKKSEPIVKDISELKNKSLEDYICEKINSYRGKSDKELCEIFDMKYDEKKAQWISLAFRMLGLKSNKAEELAKANIIVKAIRIEENGTMKESSSLPTITFKELVNEKWEDSTLYQYFDEKKFLFVIYKKIDGKFRLRGSQIWNMPHQDILKAKEGWLEIQKIIKEGVLLTPYFLENGSTEIKNNFPPKSSNEVIHIRPHASKSYYDLKDGRIYGAGTIIDSDELPDGRRMTKQSFWLNNTYLLSQIKSELK